eukprot:EG_transcript_28391
MRTLEPNGHATGEKRGTKFFQTSFCCFAVCHHFAHFGVFRNVHTKINNQTSLQNHCESGKNPFYLTDFIQPAFDNWNKKAARKADTNFGVDTLLQGVRLAGEGCADPPIGFGVR